MVSLAPPLAPPPPARDHRLPRPWLGAKALSRGVQALRLLAIRPCRERSVPRVRRGRVIGGRRFAEAGGRPSRTLPFRAKARSLRHPRAMAAAPVRMVHGCAEAREAEVLDRDGGDDRARDWDRIDLGVVDRRLDNVQYRNWVRGRLPSDWLQPRCWPQRHSKILAMGTTFPAASVELDVSLATAR